MGSFEEILVKKHLKRTKARVMILKVLDFDSRRSI